MDRLQQCGTKNVLEKNSTKLFRFQITVFFIVFAKDISETFCTLALLLSKINLQFYYTIMTAPLRENIFSYDKLLNYQDAD